MVIYIKSSFAAFLFFISICSSVAQMRPDEELLFYQNKYPGEKVIILNRTEQLTYQVQGDSLLAFLEYTEEQFHLDDNTMIYGKDQIYSTSFSQVIQKEAYTLLPEKKKYRKIPVTEFKEQFGKEDFVFYDDSKKISFVYPAIGKGSKTVLKYKQLIKDPRMVGSFYFDTYLPVDQAQFIVKYPEAVQLKDYSFNMDKIKLESQRDKHEGQITETYKAREIDKIKFEDQCPSYSYLGAHIYTPPAAFKTPISDEPKILLEDQQALNQWYRSFLHKTINDDSVASILIKNIVSDEDAAFEKAEKIYHWVQSNIRYIAFEDGMRGLEPHPSSYTIEKRYGDCKDMASTIVSLMRAAGLSAQYTWIGSRDIPYKYSELPSPITDNHMIASWQHEGQIYFLDATGQYTAFGMPTSMIQGKEAFITLNDTEYQIAQVPIIPSSENIMKDSVNIQLIDDEIQGSGAITLTGYAKSFNNYKLIGTNQKQIDKYVERLASKGNNKFALGDYKIEGIEDLEAQTNINYDFSIPDYYRVIGDKIYINPILDRSYTDATIENREVPIENEYQYQNKNIVTLEIPEGYELENIPENVKERNEYFAFSIDYHLADHQLIVTKTFEINYLMLPVEAFEEWNKTIKAYAKACKKAIILSKSS